MDYPFPILKYFEYSHLPLHLQEISKPFYELAYAMISGRESYSSLEAAAGLIKLLEAKDCFVRSAIQ